MPRPSTSNSNDVERSLLHFDNNNRRKKSCRTCLKRCILIFTCTLIILSLVVFVLLFVGFPLTFMNSISLQRTLLFLPLDGPMGDCDFGNVNGYLRGSRNLYVTLNASNLTLGVWHIQPEPLANESTAEYLSAGGFDYGDGQHPVLLHFHGNGANRIYNIDSFRELRRYFHVIAFDYRGYGDSSKAELTEDGIVQDSVELYEWLSGQTGGDIYMWGHSLGAAIATRVAAKLKNHTVPPTGLILEAPYTNLREEVLNYPLAKIFTWLPWFEWTILTPLERNGFRFASDENVLDVDCPVMILHAEDDSLIPCSLGKKLAGIAMEGRDSGSQGNVTLHVFPGKFRYDHWGITTAPELPRYLRSFMDGCGEFKKKKGF